MKCNIAFNLFPKCYFLFDLEGNTSKIMISSTICLKHCHHFLWNKQPDHGLQKIVSNFNILAQKLRFGNRKILSERTRNFAVQSAFFFNSDYGLGESTLENIYQKFANLVKIFCHPANIYLFKVNNRSSMKKCEICLKLTRKTPERHQWRRSGVFIVNFKHISHLFLVILLLILNR